MARKNYCPESHPDYRNTMTLLKSGFYSEISMAPKDGDSQNLILCKSFYQQQEKHEEILRIKTDTDTRKIKVQMLMSALTATLLTGICMLTAEDEGLK